MSSLPFFYIHHYTGQSQLELEETTSRHIVQVLRMQAGEMMQLTDGAGKLLRAEIIATGKKQCTVAIRETTEVPPPAREISIGISLVKNSSRFEWFLEKATEIGVTEIIPLICERTEKEKFRYDRMQNICISALLQSQQCWLPRLREPRAFSDLVHAANPEHRFIAHCIEEGDRKPLSSFLPVSGPALILIGPEGDFTPSEVSAALQHHFLPVLLGETRLRTETAGMVAAVLLCLG